MRHAGIYIGLVLLLLLGLGDGAPKRNETKVNRHRNPDQKEKNVQSQSHREQNAADEDLPVLPPIILLDFGNGTDENSTDEKPKRTVNDGIGYGYQRNNPLSGKYNYYFPGGKTGTTVSIEASLTPFLPKTIIEKVPDPRTGGLRSFGIQRQNPFDPSGSRGQTQQDFRYTGIDVKSQTPFGVRSNLQGANSNSQHYRNFLSNGRTPTIGSQANSGYRGGFSTTPSSLLFSSTERSSHVGSNYPATYRHPIQDVRGYEQRQSFAHVNPVGYNGNRQGFVESSTPNSIDYDPRLSASSPFPNLPKYTVENGVRYENKIFWKYPDGRVSEHPPQTYVETYSGFSPLSQNARPQRPISIYETGSTENNLYSQGPIQFPTVPETSSEEPSPFISSESLSSSLPQQQAYRLGYQNLVGQKQTLNLAQQGKPSSPAATSSSTFFSQAVPMSKSHQRPVSKYLTNSPNPEYVDSSDSKSSTTSSIFTASGELSPHILSRYTTKVQNYLRKVFAAGKKQGANSKTIEDYSHLQYSDLINYNPSISQYIKDPSSILNVHPTFVQAGNSLIPVIILRVDGTPPIQPQPTANVNLKALLQQYLLQYANNLQELAQPSSYDFDAEQARSEVSSGNPVYDRTHGIQTQTSYSLGSYRESSRDKETEKSVPSYGERTGTRQKVKSVQIVEDPRFTTYKIKN